MTLPAVTTTTASSADAAREGYGRHLAAECLGCHRMADRGGAIPVIAGKPQEEIVEALAAYRDGRKTNPVMVSVATSLDAEETVAVAAYLASLRVPIAD